MLAPWIIENLPPHRIYVEPYGGAGSVLLSKPRVYAEVYNDLDGEVVNVFKVMRDPETATRLKHLLRMTPFSRVEFEAAYETNADPVERARRAIIRSFMGFGSAAVNPKHRTGFRSKSYRSGTSPAWDWRNYPSALSSFTKRLQGVCIEQRPALELMKSSDRPDVLFYVDPPYVRGTRYGGHCYANEMTDKDHYEMAETLMNLRGMVVLSGYECALYSQLFSDWPKIQREALADGAKPRIETLWFNPAAWRVRPNLFSGTEAKS